MHLSALPPMLWVFQFAALWVAMAALLSWAGGWAALARDHRGEGPPPPNRRWFQSGSVGWADYRGCLIVGGSEAALSLGVSFLFRPFHPRLQIPWAAITRRTRAGAWIFQWDTLAVTCSTRTVLVRLSARTTRRFEQQLPSAVVV